MNLVATLEAMAESGASVEMILNVVRRHEAEREVAAMRRREVDAARQAAKRERERHAESRGQAVTERDSRGPSPHVSEGDAQVVVLTSSLRSEALPPEKATPSTPKGAGQVRGTRLPDDWTPPDDRLAGEMGMNAEDYLRQADIFRDYWRAVPGAKGRKTDWPATWRNWLRRASENASRKTHERHSPNAKFTARQDALAAHERGADIAARFHREH